MSNVSIIIKCDELKIYQEKCKQEKIVLSIPPGQSKSDSERDFGEAIKQHHNFAHNSGYHLSSEYSNIDEAVRKFSASGILDELISSKKAEINDL